MNEVRDMNNLKMMECIVPVTNTIEDEEAVGSIEERFKVGEYYWLCVDTITISYDNIIYGTFVNYQGDKCGKAALQHFRPVFQYLLYGGDLETFADKDIAFPIQDILCYCGTFPNDPRAIEIMKIVRVNHLDRSCRNYQRYKLYHNTRLYLNGLNLIPYDQSESVTGRAVSFVSVITLKPVRYIRPTIDRIEEINIGHGGDSESAYIKEHIGLQQNAVYYVDMLNTFTNTHGFHIVDVYDTSGVFLFKYYHSAFKAARLVPAIPTISPDRYAIRNTPLWYDVYTPGNEVLVYQQTKPHITYNISTDDIQKISEDKLLNGFQEEYFNNSEHILLLKYIVRACYDTIYGTLKENTNEKNIKYAVSILSWLEHRGKKWYAPDALFTLRRDDNDNVTLEEFTF